MPQEIDIKLSRPASRDPNIIDYTKGEDVILNFDLSGWNTDWKDEAYNLTVYDKDRGTIYSEPFDSDSFSIKLDNFSTSIKSGEVAIEDRTDPDNIDTIQVIAFLVFVQFPGGTVKTKVGTFDVENEDGSLSAVPYYETGF